MTIASLLEWPLVVLLLVGSLADSFNVLSDPSWMEDRLKLDRNFPGRGVVILVTLVCAIDDVTVLFLLKSLNS